MKEKTLKELRVRAKALGLKGYSKMTKEELLRRLGRATSSVPASPSVVARRERAGAPPTKPREKKTSATTMPVAKPAARTVAAHVDRPPATPSTSVPTAPSSDVTTEELIGGAKYTLRPNGRPAPMPPADLGEDIDRLPALTEPAVYLLPQKPGVLYAYWRLPSGEVAQHGDYRLRLCRTMANALQVCEEVAVQLDRGGWYFHLPDNVGAHEILVQLGYYRDGEFIAAQGQSIARIPSLYASTRTDHRWWISAEDFERMYLLSGGVIDAARGYRWSASVGSPSGARTPNERMAWPGGGSSPSK
jgi:hypothetical protein